MCLRPLGHGGKGVSRCRSESDCFQTEQGLRKGVTWGQGLESMSPRFLHTMACLCPWASKADEFPICPFVCSFLTRSFTWSFIHLFIHSLEGLLSSY